MVVLRQRRLLVQSVLLVSVAICGLLMTHGFESAAVSFSGTGSAHDQPESADTHGIFDVCVFVASIAGIGFAAANKRSKRSYLLHPVHDKTMLARRPWYAPAGRSRLIDLSVLRL